MNQDFIEILAELKNRGLFLNDLRVDEAWHSFKWNPSDHTKKGSYRGFKTNYGYNFFFKNWKDESLNFNLSSSFRDLTPEEKKEQREEIEEAIRQADQKALMRYETVAIECQRRFSLALEDINHPYLIKKGIKEAFGSRVHNGVLYLPLYDIDGKLWGIETVSADGKKMSTNGMRKTGCFLKIGEIKENVLFIVEGFSTAVTLHETNGHAVVCAYGAVNMIAVATAFKERFADLEIIISGDADQEGEKQSIKAARIANASYLLPTFKSPHPDYTDWNDLKSLEGESEVAKQVLNFKASSKNARTVRQDWMQEYFENQDVRFDYSGEILTAFGPLDFTEFSAKIFLASEADGIKLSDRFIQSYLVNWIHGEREKIWNEHVDKISGFKGESSLEALKEYLYCLTGQIKEEELSVLLHFIWQVKRKAASLKIDYHMMPVFIGQTGSGKSEAILKLLSPLGPLACMNSLDACSDPRSYHFFRDYLVVNMDEMERADKTDLSGLKRMISSEKLTYRNLGKNSHSTIRNRSTLIGSSNDTLDMLIKDPTSIRRFYSIETLPTEQLMQNWERLNRIDYVNLWGCVDIQKESPIFNMMPKIKEAQKEMKFKTDVEQWIEDRQLVSDPTYFKSIEELHKDYLEFIERIGQQFHKTCPVLGKELKRLGFRDDKIMGRRGYLCVFKNSVDS